MRGDYGVIKFHDDSHLLHITRGTGTIMIDRKRYKLKKGTVIAIPPFVENIIRYNPPFEMLDLHYRVWLKNGDMLDDYGLLPIMFRPGCFRELEKTLVRMKNIHDKNHPFQQPVLAGSAHEVVLRHLYNHLVVQKKKPVDARMQKGCAFLASLDYHHFDAEEIAQTCSMSNSQFNRMFKRCYRMPPHEYWEKNRFTAIRSLLINTDQSIKQIASRFGFEDIGYFSRWFKKMSGFSPGEFRIRQEYGCSIMK